VIDKDSALKDGKYRNLTSSQYCNVSSRCQYFARDEHGWCARWCEREKIARERKIEKTSESIRKKHRTLNTDRIEEDMAFNRYFKPIIKSLW